MQATEEKLLYVEKMGRQTDATKNRKIAKLLAVGLPCPGEMANTLAFSKPHLVAILLAAHDGPTGWRIKAGTSVDHRGELGFAGLIEATGANPTPEAIAKGKGFHLSAFGLKVRSHLKRLSNL